MFRLSIKEIIAYKNTDDAFFVCGLVKFQIRNTENKYKKDSFIIKVE